MCGGKAALTTERSWAPCLAVTRGNARKVALCLLLGQIAPSIHVLGHSLVTLRNSVANQAHKVTLKIAGGHSYMSTEIRELVSFLILPTLALLIAYLICVGLSKRRLWQRHTSSEVVAATYTKWIGIVAFIVHALLPSAAIAGGGAAVWRLFTRYNAVRFAKA